MPAEPGGGLPRRSALYVDETGRSLLFELPADIVAQDTYVTAEHSFTLRAVLTTPSFVAPEGARDN